MVADDIDHRGPGTLGIMDVRPAVQVARAKVQQRHGRTAGDPRMAVGCARGDAFEQAEHRMDARLMVERGDEVHFGRAGIGEAGGDAMVGKGRDERFSAGHGLNLCIGHGVSFDLVCLSITAGRAKS